MFQGNLLSASLSFCCGIWRDDLLIKLLNLHSLDLVLKKTGIGRNWRFTFPRCPFVNTAARCGWCCCFVNKQTLFQLKHP